MHLQTTSEERDLLLQLDEIMGLLSPSIGLSKCWEFDRLKLMQLTWLVRIRRKRKRGHVFWFGVRIMLSVEVNLTQICFVGSKIVRNGTNFGWFLFVAAHLSHTFLPDNPNFFVYLKSWLNYPHHTSAKVSSRTCTRNEICRMGVLFSEK